MSVTLALPDDAPHVLVVDDDRRLRQPRRRLSRAQRLSRHRRRLRRGGAGAAGRAWSSRLIVLDVMMPGENGFDFAESLRETSDIPILMLTARGEASDRVRGLEAGRRRLSRQALRAEGVAAADRLDPAPHPRAAAAAAGADEPALRFGPFLFFAERGELRRGEDVIRLTEREREILRLLGATPGVSVSREALAGAGGGAQERTVDVQINRLRRKLERDPANPHVSANRARRRLQAGGRRMTTIGATRGAFSYGRALWRSGARSLADLFPKGLYARSLLIVIMPMVLLQTGVAYLFMQRHWDLVTHRLSNAVARDVGAVIDLYRELPLGADDKRLREIASERFRMTVDLLPPQPTAAAAAAAVLRLARPADPRAAAGARRRSSNIPSGSTPSASPG